MAEQIEQLINFDEEIKTSVIHQTVQELTTRETTTQNITSLISSSEKIINRSTEVINVEAQTIGGVEQFIETQVNRNSQEINENFQQNQFQEQFQGQIEVELQNNNQEFVSQEELPASDGFVTPPAMSPVVSMGSEMDQAAFMNQSLPGSGMRSFEIWLKNVFFILVGRKFFCCF